MENSKKTAPKKSSRKYTADGARVSKQDHEKDYFQRNFKVGRKLLKEVMMELGTINRAQIMIRLVELGHIQSDYGKQKGELPVSRTNPVATTEWLTNNAEKHENPTTEV